MDSKRPLSLFCFPHAGGDATSYGHRWRGVDDRINIEPVQLPGHGIRLTEAPFRNLDELVSHSIEQMHHSISTPENRILFGHSFGALAAFETALRCTDRGTRPAALIVSGRNGPGVAHRAPRTPHGSAMLHSLSDEELVTALRELDGIPGELERDPELLALFLPAVRADLGMAESYQPVRHVRVPCPIAVLAAENDPMIDAEGLAQWSEATDSQHVALSVSGGHMTVGEPAFGGRVTAAIDALGLFD
ncbi:thioesterase II family protein [Actinopolyspora halophila]|uniref:thioesterase II family protein n=1 Tax=Actinopolyspora halophila TaxID=1850 RepID=UPI000A065507|nr:alpha/beta fold hydrolase [Actinopolyspora halophila]